MCKVIEISVEGHTEEFEKVLCKTVAALQELARLQPGYFVGMSPDDFEKCVYEQLCKAAVGTVFEGKIKLVGGQSFPDIVAAKHFGVEVKSVKKNTWQSLGNSVLEHTRVKGVERIYVLFGKLIPAADFRVKLHRDCVRYIDADHSPRYQLDMNLQEAGNKTWYQETGITEEYLASLSDKEKRDLVLGIKRVEMIEDLSEADRKQILAKIYCRFPHLFNNSSKKYAPVMKWLVNEEKVCALCLRDYFSAGGRVNYVLSDGTQIVIPAIVNRLTEYKSSIVKLLDDFDEDELKTAWNVSTIETDRLSQLIDIIGSTLASSRILSKQDAGRVLTDIFA